MIKKFFEFDKYQTSFKQEILAGLTTFVTMAYILVVNPKILEIAGIPFGPSMVATILAAFFGTIIMGVYAKRPFAIAPYMGENAFIAYTVVLVLGYSWQIALGAIFISGIIFILLTLTHIRKWLVEAIPMTLKYSFSAGIGLFLTFIGLNQTGIVDIGVPGAPVQMGNFASPAVLLAIFTFILISVLMIWKVKGAILIGIIISTFLAFPIGHFQENQVKIDSFPTEITFPAQLHEKIHYDNKNKILTFKGMMSKAEKQSLIGLSTYQAYQSGINKLYDRSKKFPRFPKKWISSPPSIEPIFLELDIRGALSLGIFNIILIVFVMAFVDTIGTLIGVSARAGFLDEKGNLPEIEKPMLADALATTFASLVGTITSGAYMESIAGIEAGGKTGFTAVVTAFLFLSTLFLSPFLEIIPPLAYGPALILIGLLMLSSIAKIDFEDYSEAIPSFTVVVLMSFTYNIGVGITGGFLLYPLFKIVSGRYKEIHKGLWVLAGLSALFFIFYPYK